MDWHSDVLRLLERVTLHDSLHLAKTMEPGLEVDHHESRPGSAASYWIFFYICTAELGFLYERPKGQGLGSAVLSTS